MSMRARLALPLLFVLILVGGAGCKAARQKPDQAPALANLAWGAPLAKTKANLERAGWELLPDAGQSGISLRLPEADAEAAEALPELAEAAPERYRIVLLGAEDKLQIVAIHRRDNNAALDAFKNELLASYGASAAFWTSPERSSDQASGNRLIEKVSLYETGAVFVALHESRFLAAEARQANDPNSILEARVYSREHNEGISKEALQASVEQ